MNLSFGSITPYNQLPIAYVMKATRQKVYRQMHCVECGRPIGDITDKVVMLYDGDILIDRLEPDRFGILDIHCDNSRCKQYYRLEFAV